jgi:hypothetical protein
LILQSAKKEMNIAAKQSHLLNQSTPAKKITPRALELSATIYLNHILLLAGAVWLSCWVCCRIHFILILADDQMNV